MKVEFCPNRKCLTHFESFEIYLMNVYEDRDFFCNNEYPQDIEKFVRIIL